MTLEYFISIFKISLIIIQKLISVLYLGRKYNGKKSPFVIATKSIKCLGINK